MRFVIRFFPSLSLIVSSLTVLTEDGDIRLWDREKGLHVLRGHTGRVTCVRFVRRGDRVLSASVDGTVRLWSCLTGQTVFTIRPGFPVHSCAVSPNGRCCFLGNTTGDIVM